MISSLLTVLAIGFMFAHAFLFIEQIRHVNYSRELLTEVFTSENANMPSCNRLAVAFTFK
jgi:hypothetical protein